MINDLVNQRATAAAFEYDYIVPLTDINAPAPNQPPTLALATPCYENQDMLHFCIRHPDVSRLRLVGPPNYVIRNTEF